MGTGYSSPSEGWFLRLHPLIVGSTVEVQFPEMDSLPLFEEQRLVTVPPGLEYSLSSPPKISPALNLVMISASVPVATDPDDEDAEPDYRSCAVVNDHVSQEFRTVSSLQCIPDGSRWTYVAQDLEVRRRTVNGQRQGEEVYYLISNGTRLGEMAYPHDAYISPDGRQVAFRQKRPDPEGSTYPHQCFVIEGKEGPTFRSIDQCGFNSRGTFAYRADRPHMRKCVVVGGKQSKDYGNVDHLTWSPDGRRFAYVAQEVNGRPALIVNGKRGDFYFEIGYVTFSPDSRKIAFRAHKGHGHYTVVCDGREGPPIDAPFGGIQYSADSQSFFYIGRTGTQACLYVNHEPGPSYDTIEWLKVGQTSSVFSYIGTRETKRYVVLSGTEYGPFDSLGEHAVSQDGRHIAYAAHTGGQYAVFLDNTEVGRFTSSPGKLTVNHDGTRVSFTGRAGGRSHVVVGNESGESFSMVGEPTFLPDGKTVAYTARRNEEVTEAALVVGQRVYPVGRVVSKLVFDAQGARIAFVEFRNREFWRRVIKL